MIIGLLCILFEAMSLISFANFLLGYLFLSCKSSLYILHANSLSAIWFARYFLLFCGLSFHFLDGIIWSTNVFNFDEIQGIYFFFFWSFLLLMLYVRRFDLAQGQGDFPAFSCTDMHMFIYKSYHLLSTCLELDIMPCTVKRVLMSVTTTIVANFIEFLYEWSHLILTMNHWGKYEYICFTDRETEDQKHYLHVMPRISVAIFWPWNEALMSNCGGHKGKMERTSYWWDNELKAK